jgi:hypothetical protein
MLVIDEWGDPMVVLVASWGDGVFLEVFLFLAFGSFFSSIVAYFPYFLLFSFLSLLKLSGSKQTSL